MDNIYKLQIRCHRKKHVKVDKPALVNSNNSTIYLDESRVVGRRSSVVGDSNKVEGYKNRVFGLNNIVVGMYCVVVGDDNTVNGDYMVVRGDRNIIRGNHCTVIGEYNELEGKDHTVSGGYNRVNGIYVREIQFPSDTSDKVAEEGEATCIVCVENKAVCVFLPCGHFKFCMGCSKKLTTCPECRAEIISVHRVYD